VFNLNLNCVPRTFREEEEHPMQGAISRGGVQRRHGASDFMMSYTTLSSKQHILHDGASDFMVSCTTLHSNNCKLGKNAILLE
jgi:hypothetical protein